MPNTNLSLILELANLRLGQGSEFPYDFAANVQDGYVPIYDAMSELYVPGELNPYVLPGDTNLYATNSTGYVDIQARINTVDDLDNTHLRLDGTNAMQANLNINGNNLVNTDQIVGETAVTIKDSTSASVVTIDSSATHISGIAEFTGSDASRKLKIDCNGTQQFLQFNHNYRSFLDPFQFGGQEGFRLGIQDSTDTNASFLAAVNDDANPQNNAMAILVNNNLAAGFVNNSDSGNPNAVLPYCGIGVYSNTPGLLPTDKLSVRDGSIGLHSFDKTVLGLGSLDVLRLCYDTSDY